MNTIRSIPHMELAIAGAVTLGARVARAAFAAIRSSVNSQGSPAPMIFGRWSW